MAENHFDLEKYWLFLAESGSFAQNLNTETSDHDMVGVTALPFEYMVMPYTNNGVMLPWTHWEWKDANGFSEGKFYSLNRFVMLLVEGNPNVVSLLWNKPEFNQVNPLFKDFLEYRSEFLSMQTVMHSMGFAKREVSEMRVVTKKANEKKQQMVKSFGYYPKSAVSALRVLLMAYEMTQTGECSVYRTKDKEMLMSVKRGEWTLQEVLSKYDELYGQLQNLKHTVLPLEPNKNLAFELTYALHKKMY